jgi:peroxiredoxin
VAQVVSQYDEIKTLNTRVIAISFGLEYWVRAWLEQTQAPFPVLLDPHRASYRTYGLEKSFWRAWSVKSLWYYAKAVLRGELLQGFRGETDQLGGDFIIDNRGIIRFAYPSHDPTDRPSIETLLTALRQLETTNR